MSIMKVSLTKHFRGFGIVGRALASLINVFCVQNSSYIFSSIVFLDVAFDNICCYGQGMYHEVTLGSGIVHSGCFSTSHTFSRVIPTHGKLIPNQISEWSRTYGTRFSILKRKKEKKKTTFICRYSGPL